MSKNHNSTVLITDLTLGLVGSALPPSHTVDHAVRYFNSWSGNDKLMMLLQYGVKLLGPVMQRRAELQFQAGKRAQPSSLSIEGLNRFADQLSLTRRISGFWGILAIIRGLSTLERNQPASRFQLNVQRLQGLSMLAFYPLDYISYFSSSPKPLLYKLSPKTAALAGLWSVRAWGVYVALTIISSLKEWRDLASKERVKGLNFDVITTRKRKEAVIYQLASDLIRVPVILHWSTIGGLYKNEFWTNFLSFISGLAAFKGGWEASRIPPPPI